jgi:hypothetical protein
MVLEARAVDAEVFGKPPAFIYFEEDDRLFLRKNAQKSQYLYSNNRIPHICGATLSGKTEICRTVRFSENLRACVDANFLQLCIRAGLRLYLSNIYGFITVRGREKLMHTWRADEDWLKKSSTPVGNRYDIKALTA